MADTRSIEAGVVIPALQAGISAGLTALAVGAGGRLAGWEAWRDVALCGAGLVGAGVWGWQLAEWTEILRAEAGWWAAGGDQQQSTEEQPIHIDPLRVQIHSDDNHQVQLLDLPTTADKLAKLAAAILEGATFSEAQWTGAGGLFTRAEFGQLRAELLRRGLLAWASPGTPARGVQLTRGGKSAFRYFASMTKGPAAINPPE